MSLHCTTNIHRVTSISVEAKFLNNGVYITTFCFQGEDGDRQEITTFSKGPLVIEGAEHVNFVASDEVAA